MEGFLYYLFLTICFAARVIGYILVFGLWNGMITDGEYDYYTCRKCGTEWKVLREDYKNRRSRLQEGFLLDLITSGFVIVLAITFIILSLK